MKKLISSISPVTLVIFVTLVMPPPVPAQLADASSTTLGLSGNNTATVRGLAAIAVNPAGLAMSGSGFSLALFPVQVRSDLHPIGLSDLKDVQRTVIPSATREDWLARVTAEGTQTGSFGIDISEFAFTTGNIGFQVSTLMVGTFSLPPGAIEGLLYGNAGRTGSASSLDLSNALLQSYAISTVGLSIGIPIPISSTDLAVGVTAKYSIGHDILVSRSASSSIQNDPVRATLNFPIIQTADGYIGDLISSELAWKFPRSNGDGIGVDVGFMLEHRRLSLGASVENIFNTFSWDESKLIYRPGTALFEIGQSNSDFTEAPYVSAPANLRALIDNMAFEPSLRVGAALDLTRDFTVSGDLHTQFGDRGASLSPKFHLGLGTEFRGMRVLYLRGGAAVITDGIQYGGGASLVLGPVNISAAGAFRTGTMNEQVLGQVTLSFGGH